MKIVGEKEEILLRLSSLKSIAINGVIKKITMSIYKKCLFRNSEIVLSIIIHLLLDTRRNPIQITFG